MKYNMELRIIFLFVLVTAAIFITGFFAQYASSRTNLFQTLGFSLRERCSGSLFLSVSGTERCLIKAKILTSDCIGKTYQIRESSCMGALKCEGTVEYDSFQTTCSWNVPSGNYNYVLCVNKGQKDSASVMCS